MILIDQCITVDEFECSLQISRGSAHQIIHDSLALEKCLQGGARALLS